MEAAIDRDALTRYVDRVLALHEDRKLLNADIADTYGEAKSNGFVPAVIRQIVRERQMDAKERDAHYNLLDSYRRALGMLADTPLGEAAFAAATVETAVRPRPRPFAEQPVNRRGPGRPKKPKPVDLVGEPAGAA